ncbi:MAG: GNAT family N-acetyltransferase [Rhodothermales bacterium]|nr:GNAT family N-acetyltransferase [Rhodothermales bacterium]
MRDHPVLKTERLTLRSFRANDASRLQRLAGNEAVARTTFLPYPYNEGQAESWIRHQEEDYLAGRLTNFAIELRASQELIGSIGLMLEPAYRHAQLGYWLGEPYWGRGYGTEAAEAVVAHGFQHLDLHRIFAAHFSNNPASGRILIKVGMRHEGRQREHYLRFNVFEDAEIYGILRREFEERAAP